MQLQTLSPLDSCTSILYVKSRYGDAHITIPSCMPFIHMQTQPDVKATILPSAIISLASHHPASIGPIFSLKL
ncbi:hypothetical protein TsFJ059_001764 [Trichoderma semiorbis]|uniref:Uncharacterized protein n=1 Tax=Trichoderma semiorbis TaxID=1491008 RepID=A0A9P8HY33_9HYPO|nr:hypothetical protein TsFJ059_001764 [Trichoderma semiorbis]